MRAERNRRYVSRVSGDALTAEVETTLTPRGGGTQLDDCWAGTGRTPLLRILLARHKRISGSSRILSRGSRDVDQVFHLRLLLAMSPTRKALCQSAFLTARRCPRGSRAGA